MFKKETHFSKTALAIISVIVMLCMLSANVSAAASNDGNTVQFKSRARYNSAAAVAESSSESEDFDDLESYLFEKFYNLEEQIDISGFKIEATEDNETLLTYLIWFQMPAAFHIDGLGTSNRNGYIQYVYVRYLYSYDEYHSMYKEFTAAADKLLVGVENNNSLSNVQKALILHDRLVVWNEYDMRVDSGTVPQESYSAYGALVNRTSVCDGYTMAYTYLLDRVGIASLYCSSNKMNHAWNIVQIDDVLYHTDVTWDDPSYDITGRVSHDNFMLSTQKFKETHNADDYVTDPIDTRYDNYFWQNSTAEFQLLGNAIYYIDNKDETLRKLESGADTYVLSVEDIWWADSEHYWVDNEACLGSDGKNLFFSLSNAVYKYDIKTGQKSEVFRPDLSVDDYFGIYGFTYSDGYLICDLFNSPNFEEETKQKYQVRYKLEDPTPTIELSKTESELFVGGTLRLTAVTSPENQTVIWESSDPAVAAVANGQVTALSEGDAEITAKFVINGEIYSASCRISVKELPVLTGDANGDGTVDLNDAVLIAQFDVGNAQIRDGLRARADANFDGNIDIKDALLVARYFANLIKEFK